MKSTHETVSEATRILDLTREGWAIDRASVDWALQQTGDLRCDHINTVAECQKIGERHALLSKSSQAV